MSYDSNIAENRALKKEPFAKAAGSFKSDRG